MKLTFYGATRKVTGSMFLLELEDGYKILIDCGSDLGNAKNLEEINTTRLFPFEASLVNLVLLTHAHIDHSGNIPNLYEEGFEGQVLCTAPTLELTNLLLLDAANLNSRKTKEIDKSRKLSKKFKQIASAGLFLQRHVKVAMDNFVSIAFNNRFKFKDDGYVTFIPAGHLLGAAYILIEVKENGTWKKIGFSGDIGRYNYPLLADPHQLPEVDYLVCESTYGNRVHENKEIAENLLETIINEVCVNAVGRLIIPAFSVGRTQALLYTLNKIYLKRNFKPIKVFTDSPLAKESSKVYEKYSYLLNDDAKSFKKDFDSLFDFENLFYLESNLASKAVSNHNEACIIISSSGMITGGRVEHHVAQNIGNPYAMILLIGYATEGTLGHQLLNGERKELTIQGKKETVLAQIKKIDVFSGHGDLNDLINFVASQPKEQLKKIFLVHGEYQTMLDFKQTLQTEGFNNIEIPNLGESYEL